MSKRHGRGKPRFPRKRWLPGQRKRVETPEKGKGSYRRGRKRHPIDGQTEESLGEAPASEEDVEPGEQSDSA